MQAYVQTYLTEEIAAEAFTRDLPRFSRFLQTAALSNAELLNYSSIASDLGVSPTTVRENYRILEDTLIGFLIEPISKPRSRKEVSTSKFYLFDVGVCNTLRGVHHVEQSTEDFGKIFEHFIGLEIYAALQYKRLHQPLNFWRTHSKKEVDFVVKDLLAVEVKATHKSSIKHAEGLIALSTEHPVKHYCLVSQDPVDRVKSGIKFLNYMTFLKDLWSGKWFK